MPNEKEGINDYTFMFWWLVVQSADVTIMNVVYSRSVRNEIAERQWNEKASRKDQDKRANVLIAGAMLFITLSTIVAFVVM